MNRNILLKFLHDNGYDFLWTVVGWKEIIGGRMSQVDWKGRLEISGAWRILGNNFEGTIKTTFLPGG